MKKYVLFLFGDFKNEEIPESILYLLSSISDSNYLKFKLGYESLIVHFGSNCSKFEYIDGFVNTNLTDFVSSYFLVENNDNMSLNMSKNELADFLSLDSVVNSNDENIKNIEKMESSQEEDDMLLECGKSILKLMDNDKTEEECDFDEEDTYIKKSYKKEYNLDEILDKINETGISSLTKEENEYLNKLSK